MTEDGTFLADLRGVQAHLVLGHAEELLDRPALREALDHFDRAQPRVGGEQVGDPLGSFRGRA